MAVEVQPFAEHVVLPSGPVHLDERFTLDASDPFFYDEANKPDAFGWIHENGGIYYLEHPRFAQPFVNACKHSFIRIVGTNPDLFTVRYGMHLNAATYAVEATPMPDDPRLAIAMRAMTIMDREEHQRVRGPINPLLKPAVVATFEPMFRERIRSVVDELEEGECDFMEEFAHQVPLRVVTSVLGVDPARDVDFDRWSKAVLGSFEPGAVAQWDTITEMIDFFEDEINKRKTNPTDDMITRVMNAGLPEGDLQAIMWCWLLLVGGIETTEYLIGCGMWQLLLHPEQMKYLVETPDKIAAALAEMLRYSTPARYIRRQATADTEVGGLEIKEGTVVVMNYTAANYDPELFPDPFRFDITRKQSDAWSFGIGPHHCIGSFLARLEVRVAFEELLKRFPNTEINGDARFRPNLATNDIETLPVIFRT
jgi:cytochrome P450